MMVKSLDNRLKLVQNVVHKYFWFKYLLNTLFSQSEGILDMGLNSNVNTTSNESHHKADKKTAQRTNKRPGTFDIMVATKIQERTAIALGIEETHGRKRWHYYHGNFDHSDR